MLWVLLKPLDVLVQLILTEPGEICQCPHSFVFVVQEMFQ